MLCLTTQNKPSIRMGFTMSLSLVVGLGFIPSVTKIKWKREHAHRDIETGYLGIQSKTFPESCRRVRTDPEFGICGRRIDF